MSLGVTRLRVDAAVLQNNIGQFRNNLTQLRQFMENVRRIISLIAKVAWVSPASAALFVKFMTLFRAVEEAVRIADEYVRDLEEALSNFVNIERSVQGRMEGLMSGESVFGV